jgi:ornithine cyclodeaminase
MDPELVARARLIVDSRAAALQESGDVVLGIQQGRFTSAHIAAELGQVISSPELGRTGEKEVIIFKSLGLAVEDLVAAHLAYRRTVNLNRGASLA